MLVRTLIESAVIAILVTQLAIMATTIYLHRALSHRALKLARVASFGFRVIIWVTTGIVAREWVAVHRKHHAYTDVEGDPHSPVVESFAMIQFANIYFYRKAAKDKENLRKYAKDIPPDSWDRILFDRPLLGLGLGVLLLLVLFGPLAAILISLFHAVCYVMLSAAVNAVGHTFGDRPNGNLATNNRWLAFLTFGEGLHNNHHAVPTAARLSFRKTQIDTGWWIIRLLEMVGQATVRLPRAKVFRSIS